MSATVPESVHQLLKAFRLRKSKSLAALILKIDLANLVVEHDQTLEDLASLQDLADELPETTPRYIMLSYVVNHKDGRVSYPLVFVQYTPAVARPDQKMIYAGTRTDVGKAVGTMGKCLELFDADDLTDAWVLAELNIAA
ncbi:hypothetical protein BCR44DRAFT_64833 [Catenaria anguillulae PL171]|uniref:ADF-H domain-containing protein n=1 Tax=Catenaria anguillulae PL171 TaxID=765915 RepID=A0A1Y2HZ44_9FUNG|nr:hypothetical protein BCR44DRAFT_64833 [Catenaria anguillulae PL171]